MSEGQEPDYTNDLATAVWMPMLASTYSDLTHAEDATGVILNVQAALKGDLDITNHEMIANLEDVLSALGDARGEIIRLATLCSMGGYNDDQLRNLSEYDVQAWATAEEITND